MNPWTTIRDQFPVVDRLIYLDHAAVSPLPLRSRERISEHLDEAVHRGGVRYPDTTLKTIRETRALGAELLGTKPDHVFFVRSTTQGLGIAATGIPFREGDNMVLVEREFPANQRPWLPLKRRGVEIRWVPQREGRVSLDDLRGAVDRRTRALSVSWVQFLSGFRIDLGKVAEICRQFDALFVVDAIQALGAFDIEVEALEVDFVSADAHKWLLGPEGIGVGYASSRALERIEPVLEGWLAAENPLDFFDLNQPLKAGADRYEEGAHNVTGTYGLKGSLELILSLGVPIIAQRILDLTDYLVHGLHARGWVVLSPREELSEKSGIVLTTKPHLDMDRLAEYLAQHKVAVSFRGGALRISPHCYNTFDELDRMMDLLSTFPNP